MERSPLMTELVAEALSLRSEITGIAMTALTDRLAELLVEVVAGPRKAGSVRSMTHTSRVRYCRLRIRPPTDELRRMRYLQQCPPCYSAPVGKCRLTGGGRNR